MIYNMIALNNIYKNVSNLNQKVSLECKKGKLYRIKRGLYSTNIDKDAPIIANLCCEPSYISFEYALSYYGMIPELVSMFTCACFKKKNYKKFSSNGYVFEYRSIPDASYPYLVDYLKNEDGIRYKIASKEKALLDILYSKYSVRSFKDLEYLLFNDLRIDEDCLETLNKEELFTVGPLYHCNTINTFLRYLKRLISLKL